MSDEAATVARTQPWADDSRRLHDSTCDGYRYCDTDTEDDAGGGVFVEGEHDNCDPPRLRPCGGCWNPSSTPAYIAVAHRAQMRRANAGRGLDEMVRLVRLGTMLQSSLDAARDEHEAASRALGAVHSTPIGSDPLPGPLHWDALEMVAKRLHGIAGKWGDRRESVVAWEFLPEGGRNYWLGEARALLAEAVNAGES